MLGILLMDVRKRLSQVLQEGKAGKSTHIDTQSRTSEQGGGGRRKKAKGHRGIGGDRTKEDATRGNKRGGNREVQVPGGRRGYTTGRKHRVRCSMVPVNCGKWYGKKMKGWQKRQ